MNLISQLSGLPSGALETWVICALVVVNGLVAVKALGQGPKRGEFVTQEELRRFAESVEGQLRDLRQAVEHLRLEIQEDGERRSQLLQQRMGKIEAAVARVDERTRGPS